jgi:methionyl-tRNA formyltransferase
MGTPEYAAVSLRALLASRHCVKAVVTRPDKPRGRGQQMEASAVKRLAAEHGIRVLDPPSPRTEDFLAELRGLACDLGVVVAYGRILPRAALDAPRLGCINAHASLLPELRGAAPIERAILAGKTETGVTIMQMDEGLDEGDMLLARSLAIGGTTTGAELREQLAVLSAELLVEAVDRFADDPASLEPRKQDHAAATFAPPLRKSDAAIRWHDYARELALRVRAFAPRPGAYAYDGSTRLKILEAQAVEGRRSAAPGTVTGATERGIVVATGDGALEITMLQPEGRRAMSALDYERGVKSRASATGTDEGARVLHDGE